MNLRARFSLLILMCTQADFDTCINRVLETLYDFRLSKLVADVVGVLLWVQHSHVLMKIVCAAMPG